MLTFEASTHTYFWNGRPVINVTAILGELMDFSHVSPEDLAYAQSLGAAVHIACELDDKGDLVEETVADVVKPYLGAYRKFKAECKPKWEALEEKVYHPLHQVAGTLDRRGWLCNSKAIVDLKSGAEHPAVALQTSAYLEAYCARSGEPPREYRRFALYLKDTGHYVLREIDLETPHHADFRDFLCALGSFRWKQRNNLIRSPHAQ